MLVVGAGVAGLRAALEAARHARVVLVSWAAIGGSASDRAQGGVAAALDEDDTPQLHAEDTLRAGRGLSRRSAVDLLVRDAPERIRELREWGVGFDGEASLEGGHGRRRVRAVGGSRTGEAIVAALARRVLAHPGISVTTGERVIALWRSDDRCVGARTDRRMIAARGTVLATGGYAALWWPTTNPSTSQGDGIALAYAAGAAVADLEFVQFHPTVLASPRRSLLLTEALRGEGALLLDERGERFTDELAPRDEVSRAVAARGGAWLDLRGIQRDRFGALIEALREAGCDPAREPIPVVPAAHYTMGGVAIDLDGHTSLDGLYAAGECACSGVHGANRLASNSLLECLVFGARAGAAAAEAPALPAHVGAELPSPVISVDIPLDVREDLARSAGVVREPSALRELHARSSGLVQLIAAAGLERAESRGAHYRSDVPHEVPSMLGHLVVRKGRGMTLEHMTLEQWS